MTPLALPVVSSRKFQMLFSGWGTAACFRVVQALDERLTVFRPVQDEIDQNRLERSA